MNEHVVVPAERAGLELDEFLCLLYPECGKGFLRRQVRDGLVLVDGQRALPSMRLATDQVLMVSFDEAEAPASPVDPGVPIPILYEDDDVLVLDKPAGLAVEPERWAREAGSVAGALLALARTRSDGGPEAGTGIDVRLRGVHRLDKDTSGCLVVAKHLEAERALRGAFERHEVEKTYLALVEGEHPLGDGEEDVIDLAIGPDDRRSGRVVIDEKDGKPARTRIAVAERFRGYTWMRCHPESGRTHQIRVHLAATGFPLAVDPLYGRRDALRLSDFKAGYRPKKGRVERPLVQRLTLHAAHVRLASPGDPGRHVEAEAPLPKDLSQLRKQLGKVRAWRR